MKHHLVVEVYHHQAVYPIITTKYDWIVLWKKKFDGLIINAAGYTHTSVAIRDALMILKIPIVELHITNIYNWEKFRHKSLLSKAAKSVICGFGTKGYILALEGLKEIIKYENR